MTHATETARPDTCPGYPALGRPRGAEPVGDHAPHRAAPTGPGPLASRITEARAAWAPGMTVELRASPPAPHEQDQPTDTR
jgi:hypothetical protein